MQLDGNRLPEPKKFEKQVQRALEKQERIRRMYRFEENIYERLESIDRALHSMDARIESEISRRVTEEVTALLTGKHLKSIIDAQIAEVLAVPSASSVYAEPPCSSAASSSFSASSSSVQENVEEEDEEETETEGSESEESEDETEDEGEEEEDDDDEDDEEDAEQSETDSEPDCFPSTSAESHYPNKWEFISTFNPGMEHEFYLDQFTLPVRSALNLPAETELFPRMSLEEMIERDHPTTSDSRLYDEKKITCKNRPNGKQLTDEEFFCLAPCCSYSRLYQAASCPFLPSFVQKRMVSTDETKVIMQSRENGIELITCRPSTQSSSIVHQTPFPLPPNVQDVEEEEEKEEEEDPLANRTIVEQLMYEHFIPTPAEPNDEFIFGPYIRRVRESDVVSADLLRSLVRRVNSNLDHSYQSHRELELFAELDSVLVDEEFGRLSLDRMNNI